MRPTLSHANRTVLIRSALESPDPGALNGGSNIKFRPLGTDVITFEVAGVPIFQIFLEKFYELIPIFVVGFRSLTDFWSRESIFS